MQDFILQVSMFVYLHRWSSILDVVQQVCVCVPAQVGGCAGCCPAGVCVYLHRWVGVCVCVPAQMGQHSECCPAGV